MAEDARRTASTALALVQGVIDAGATPTDGVWFVTRGAQVLEQDILGKTSGELAGATLWGFGKVMALEAAHLQPRLIDLDPDPNEAATSSLVDELLLPDPETHVAYRGCSRLVARLVRGGVGDSRLALPEDAEWGIGSRDPESGLAALRAKPRPRRALEPGEVRLAVEAMGLNYVDIFLSMGAVAYNREIGREMYGRVLETAHGVEGLSVGDRVVGLGFGSFAPEMITRAVMVAPVPEGFSAHALATVPVCFVTAELAFKLAGLQYGERVLIHAGAGGVGLAAIQLAHAAGAEVFATASAPKQAYLRSLGVEHVFDSRTTAFGEEVLEATGGEGVHVLLNSLTGEGFIEASLSCLARGGRFVEISKRRIRSEEEMAASRPDVAYSILDVDALKWSDPARPGGSLSRVLARHSTGELTPLPHTVWPLSEVRAAMEVMRDARHIGKNVLRMPPLARGSLRQDRTYLITGGMGGIGCAVARWLAENGAGTIVLNGRRDPDPAAKEVIKDLREGGADVRVEVADVTDCTAVDEVLTRIDEVLPPLGGVIHSVGVLSDGVIENQTWERFEQVMWPKVLGAWHLHQATRNKDLDMFILFSSVTGVVGNSGQSNHAAANAFLDQLAAHRRSLGLPGQAIAWGAWSGIGEAEEQRERIERQLAYTGAGWLTPVQGMKAFDQLVRQDVTAPTVTTVDWSVIAKGLETHPPFFEDILEATEPPNRKSEDSAPSAGLLSRLRDTPAEQQQNLLESFIQQELQAVLRLSSPPSTTVSFFDLGMDSLMAVELRNRLNRALADEYRASNTVVFDYPDVAALARHLAAELEETGAADAPSKPLAPKRWPPKRRESEGADIAIVGMACRFPGAPDLRTFWRQLEAGETAVTDGRRNAGPWDGALGDSRAEASVHRIGGFVSGLDQFDAGFFGIRTIEARVMDPQQRFLLETSWHALEDAGVDPARLKGSRCGVYFGIADSEYRHLMKEEGGQDSYFGNSMGVAVGRVSFAFGMEGPAMPVELACASSLVSIHHAVVGLQLGETDMALAGGVNVILSADTTSKMAEFGMLSRTGRCWSFDAAADGYVRGEGCGVVVLKRLAEAEADGDRIWGVIRGSATNQNGVSGGLVMPNGPAQRRAIEEALTRADIEPSQVDYLEAHANGSEMGDAIEVLAAAEAYGNGREPTRPLLIGTVKTNIGHLESAAGVAGLIKVMLSMKHGMIPQHLNFENPNPNMDWDKLPVQVTSEAVCWPPAHDRPPRAGISAFSMTGTNAHLIVEGYGAPEAAAAADAEQFLPSGSAHRIAVSLPEAIPESPTVGELRPRRTRMLPLSGKSGDALRELAGRYVSWLDERAGELSAEDDMQSVLSDMAWTAAVGRSHFAHRAGVAFEDAASLREGLLAIAESDGVSEPYTATKVAFAYTGEDVCWVGMGEELYESEPVARAVLVRCDEVLRVERGASLLDVMFGRSGGLDDPAWAQPAVFALESALAALWSSIGIRPNMVIGAGSGEIAAAHAAGVFTLEDGLRFAARRGVLMEALSDAEGAEAALDDLETALEGVVTAFPSLTLVNQITGQVVRSGETKDGAYWRSQASEPAALGECVKTLAESGVEVVVEIGPDAALGPQVLSVWPEQAGDGGASANGKEPPVVLMSLKRPTDDAPQSGRAFVEAVAGAYGAGLTLDFAGLFAGEERRRVSLPSYPFQRRRFWFEAS
ncbi:MAG: SDR family NAD(P)-dependent oxidoreductase [Nitrospinae bacterium]|nr:SDR family NAD(P)-dependent oxidoreductase [Nitrospinota bacterium]